MSNTPENGEIRVQFDPDNPRKTITLEHAQRMIQLWYAQAGQRPYWGACLAEAVTGVPPKVRRTSAATVDDEPEQ